MFVAVATGPTNERPVAPALAHCSLLTNTASILDWHLSIHSIPPGSLPTMPITAVIYLNVSGSFSFRHIQNAAVNSLRFSPLHYQLRDCTVGIYPPGLSRHAPREVVQVNIQETRKLSVCSPVAVWKVLGDSSMRDHVKLPLSGVLTQ